MDNEEFNILHFNTVPLVNHVPVFNKSHFMFSSTGLFVNELLNFESEYNFSDCVSSKSESDSCFHQV